MSILGELHFSYKEVQIIRMGGTNIVLPGFSESNVNLIVDEICRNGLLHLGTTAEKKRISLKKQGGCGCLILKAPGACGGFHNRCRYHTRNNPYGSSYDIAPSDVIKQDVRAIVTLILADPNVLVKMYMAYYIDKTQCIHLWPHN